jgi:transcriptional regulator with XRE-family HTH domain
VNPDDERLGRLLRALRVQQRLTQEDLALVTGVPVRDIHKVESGRIGELVYDRIRALFVHVDARARLSVWWRGAAADRLLDAEHASIVEMGSRVVARYGWEVPTEVTYSKYGERGSIDLFGHRRTHRAVLVGEVKSAFGALEELNRTLDAKVRLAPAICEDRFGWRPRFVGRVLIVSDHSTNRRVVVAHQHTMNALYPARSREVRGWLRHPDRDLGGIWFLSIPHNARIDPPTSA